MIQRKKYSFDILKKVGREMFYGDVSWIYKIIKMWVKTGIMQLD